MNSIRNSLLFVCLLAPLVASSQTPTKQILDLKVESFHTGLEEVGNSFWVDENQFVMTTLKEGAERNVNDEDTPTRIALVNFAKKTIKYIAQDARLLDFTFDHKTRSIFIGKLHTTDPVDAEGRRSYVYNYTNLREIRIEPDSRVIEINSYPPGSAPPRPMTNMPAGGGEPLDGGRGGFLVRDLAPGDTLAKQWERRVHEDEGIPTIWIRQGKAPIPLPIRYDEIGSGEFVAFLDKYLLNDSDTAMTSRTNSHLNLVWRRPYEYTPFRLLGQDGSIEEIPYPEFVFDYGIADRKYTGAHFSEFHVMRPGILITTHPVSG